MPRPTVTTEPLDVTETGHRTEFLYDDGDNDAVLCCAAHGGRVEPGTAEAAIELATRLPAASCWACLGYDEEREEFDLYHPASTAIDPADYPLLAAVADRGFETVVSFHGLGEEGVKVGGGIDAGVKERVRDRLDRALSADVETVSGGPHGGVAPDNFVNWLAGDGGGLQVESDRGVRDEETDALVGALADLVGEGVL